MTFPSFALVKRELLTNLRRTRSIVWLGAFVGVCAIAEVSVWPSRNIPVYMVGGMSEDILKVLAYALTVGGMLVVPALAAGTIVSEREQGTFELVRMTLVRRWSIIASKLMNTLGIYVLLIVATLPMVGVLMFGVGLDAVQLALVMTVVLLTNVTFASIGLLSSTIFHRGFLAIFASYALIVAFVSVPPFFVTLGWWVICDVSGFSRYMVDNIPVVLCPFFTLEWCFFGFRGFSSSSWFVGGLLYQLGIIAACLLVSRRLLYRDARASKRITEKPIDDPEVLAARRKQFPFYLIDPLRRKPEIDDGANPMRVRELRWGLFSRGTTLVRIFYCVFPLCIFSALVIIGFEEAREAIAGWIAWEMVLLVFIAPALLANSFTKEYELGNVDMLRMTLLSPKQMVTGKAAAGLMSLGPALAASVLAAIPIILWKPGAFGVIFTGYVTLGVCAFLCLSLGLFSSLVARTTTTALVLGYLLSFAAFGGVWLCALLGSMVVGQGNGELDRVSMFLSPIWAYVFSCFDSGRATGSLTGTWLQSMVVFVCLSLGLLMLSVRLWKRYQEQDV
ncbi:MAG: ABC transporter permease subunit [bacterium]|nr:ABC transporter permease subunit [bacterium]